MMAYSRADDVLNMIRDDMLNAILGGEYITDHAELHRAALPYAQAAVEDADSEIDGYLCKRYRVPLSVVPKVIGKFSKDIAVYNMVAHTGINESDREKTILNRYNAAIQYLTNVAKGIVDIMEESGSAADASGNTGNVGNGSFSISSNGRLFTRNAMRGW